MIIIIIVHIPNTQIQAILLFLYQNKKLLWLVSISWPLHCFNTFRGRIYHPSYLGTIPSFPYLEIPPSSSPYRDAPSFPFPCPFPCPFHHASFPSLIIVEMIRLFHFRHPLSLGGSC